MLPPLVPTVAPGRMRAWACLRYGGPDVLSMASRPMPSPGPRQLLVRMQACTVESADARIRALRFPRGFGLMGRLAFGWRRPRQPVLGQVVAGTVVAVGEQVLDWAAGDQVVVATGMRLGGHAEWVLLDPRAAVVRRPASVTVEHAVSVVFGGMTALYFLERAKAAAGERLLVIGATGSVGSALVQLARHRGLDVEGMCSAGNLALARELGADPVHDYRLRPLPSLPPEHYDIIADTCGASSFAACLPLLAERGRYLGIAADLPAMLARPRRGRRAICGTAPDSVQQLQEVIHLAEAGVLQPTVDSVFDFDELPAAHARVDSGGKRGCVVVRGSTA